MPQTQVLIFRFLEKHMIHIQTRLDLEQAVQRLYGLILTGILELELIPQIRIYILENQKYQS